jgi:hypothetical protein
MNIVQQFSVQNDAYMNNVKKVDHRYIAFQSRGPVGIMLHSVGCPQPSAQVFANTWDKPHTEVAVHAVLEASGKVIQCLPWNFRGWHAGGSANDTHVGVEMTEPATIEYIGGATWKDKNPEQTMAHVLGTYQTAAELFALLCGAYRLDPLADGVIISHSEGYKRGLASGHADVEHIWSKVGLSMAKFRKDVKAIMEKKGVKEVEALVLYSGDADLPAAQMLAYKKGAYLAPAATYKANPAAAAKLYVVGGTWQPEGAVLLAGANRTETAAAVLKELVK